MTMGTQTEEVAIARGPGPDAFPFRRSPSEPPGSLSEGRSSQPRQRGLLRVHQHGPSVIRVSPSPGAHESVLRRTCSPEWERERDNAQLSRTVASRASPDASSSESESVGVSSHYHVPMHAQEMLLSRVPFGGGRQSEQYSAVMDGDPPSSSELVVNGLLASGFPSPADVMGVWTYPLCDNLPSPPAFLPRLALRGGGMDSVRLACEAPLPSPPDGSADRRFTLVPDLYHGLLARSAGALHYGAPGPSPNSVPSSLFGFPWPGHGLGARTTLAHHPLSGMTQATVRTGSPSLKFGMDRILSGEVCSQEVKKHGSSGDGAVCSRLECGSHLSALSPLAYAGLLAPTPLRMFSHTSVNQLNPSRPNGPGAQGTGSSPPGKRKRSWSRAVFSNLQRKGLEKRFQLQKYITKPDRRQLAATLGLTDAQVKVWFQNRRMKWRHTKESKPQQQAALAPQTRLNESPDDKKEHSTNIPQCV